MFYYERLLDRALSGIDGTAIISTIVNISVFDSPSGSAFVCLSSVHPGW